jgi:hypothetical protein
MPLWFGKRKVGCLLRERKSGGFRERLYIISRIEIRVKQVVWIQHAMSLQRREYIDPGFAESTHVVVIYLYNAKHKALSCLFRVDLFRNTCDHVVWLLASFSGNGTHVSVQGGIHLH